MTAVMVHHLKLGLRGGWLGVDLFFALSGFLITSAVWRLPADGKLGPFWRRRAWRILPALAVLLSWYVAVSVGAPDRSRRLSYAAAAAAQVINVQGAIAAPFSPHLGHLWSLAAEVQFYLVWPVALQWLRRRGSSRRHILALLGIVFVASAIERVALQATGTPWNRLYLAPDTRVSALVVGSAAALIIGPTSRPTPVTSLATRAGATGIVVLAATVVGLDFLAPATYFWGVTVASIAAGAVVASAAVTDRGSLRSLLEVRPLRWLGRVSYGVYLWHVPIIAETLRRWPEVSAVGKTAIVVPASLVAGWASAVIIERPALGRASRPPAHGRRICLARTGR